MNTPQPNEKISHFCKENSKATNQRVHSLKELAKRVVFPLVGIVVLLLVLRFGLRIFAGWIVCIFGCTMKVSDRKTTLL
jgi:hypothetical protein